MESIESAQAAFFCEVACGFYDCIGQLDDKQIFPIAIRVFLDALVVFLGNALFSEFPGKGGPRLRISDDRNRYSLGLNDEFAGFERPRSLDVRDKGLTLASNP
jgi:hypothetical protein